MAWRERGKQALNAVAARFGARIVGAEWGPRGAFSALQRARSLGFAPSTVVDVGASNGQWTRHCLQIFPEARYFLVDPLEENRAALQRLADSHHGVSMWSGAIGAAAGQLELYRHGDQSSFLPSRDFAGRAQPVQVRTLDSFLQSENFRAPLLLKADVQGYELEVLKGAKQCLELAEMLLLEVSFRRFYQQCVLADEVIAFAGACGFRIHDICSYTQRPADNELIQSDLLFVRESSPLFGREGWR